MDKIKTFILAEKISLFFLLLILPLGTSFAESGVLPYSYDECASDVEKVKTVTDGVNWKDFKEANGIAFGETLFISQINPVWRVQCRALKDGKKVTSSTDCEFRKSQIDKLKRATEEYRSFREAPGADILISLISEKEEKMAGCPFSKPSPVNAKPIVKDEKPVEESPKPEKPNKPEEAVPDEVRLGLLRSDCSINDKTFDDDWENYSDIDERIPLPSRSYEVQQYEAARGKIVGKRLEAFLLRRDMEVGRQTRLIMRDYREAFVKNIKVNLLKAFWRLAYITFDTVQGTPGLGEGAVGTGKSFVKIFSDEAVPIQKLGSLIKVMRDFTPGSSRLAADTEKWRGKIRATGTTAALDTLEALGDPIEVGKSVAQDIIKQTLPSADITPEEIEILRTQHLNKRVLDDALQESYKVNFLRRDRVAELEDEVKTLDTESREWKNKEKNRVATRFQKNCRAKIKK